MSVAEMPFKQKRMLISLMTFKEEQLNGARMPCPRCGNENMKPIVETNASSRQADVYICDLCGVHEAITDALGLPPLPLTQWDFIRTINGELPKHMRD